MLGVQGQDLHLLHNDSVPSGLIQIGAVFFVGHSIVERKNAKGCAEVKQDLRLLFPILVAVPLNEPARFGENGKIGIPSVEGIQLRRFNVESRGREERRLDTGSAIVPEIPKAENIRLLLKVDTSVDTILAKRKDW